MEISAHTTQSFLSTPTSLSVPPPLGHIKSQHLRPHESFTKRYQRSHPRNTNSQHMWLWSTWYQSTPTLTFNCWALPTGLGWYTETRGINHRALQATHDQPPTLWQLRGFTNASNAISLSPSLLVHTHEAVVTRTIHHDKTHEYSKSKQFPIWR